MLSIFSCACWPSVYLLWKNIFSGLLPIFSWVDFFDIELYKLFYMYGFKLDYKRKIYKLNLKAMKSHV